MRKVLLGLAMLLLWIPQLNAQWVEHPFGWFDASGLESETRAFISRVESDGGTVELTTKQISDEIKLLKAQGVYSDALLINYVSAYKPAVLYSIKGADITVARSTTGSRWNKSGVLETVANNVPRLNWYQGQLQGVLVESQRTNLVTYSSDYANAWWTKQNVTLGTPTADGWTLVSDDSNNGIHGLIRNEVLNSNDGVSRIRYFIIRKGTARYMRVSNYADGDNNASSYHAYFDLETSTTYGATQGSGVIQHLFGDTYLIGVVTTTTSSSVAYRKMTLNIMNGSALGNAVYEGDGSLNIWVRHAQATEGTFPTSPIVTNAGSSVTRNADVLTIPSSGFENVKTFIRGNTAFTSLNGTNYNSHQFEVGTHSRFYMFPDVLTSEQLTALGVTTVYEDAWVMPISGNPTNPATPTNGIIRFSATEDLDVTATGDAVLVSNVKSDDGSLRLHTVTISCPNGGSGSIVVEGREKVRSLGNHLGASLPNANYYTGTNTTAPRLTWNLNHAPTLCEKIWQNTGYTDLLPVVGNTALPAGLTLVNLRGANIAWAYTGSLPTGLTYVFLEGNNIAWSYSGALPAGLTFLCLDGTGIVWTHSGAFPIGLTTLLINGASINWTGNVLGNVGASKPNMTLLQLLVYRTTDMDYTDLISILESILDNVGTVPTTIIIRAQIAANVTAINSATPDEFGTDPERAKYLINLIKSSKSVTTFTLNATNI